MIQIPKLELIRRWSADAPAALAEQLSRFERGADKSLAEVAKGLPGRYDPVEVGANRSAFWGMLALCKMDAGSFTLFLPRARDEDRGKTLLVAKTAATNTITLQPVTGLINGAASASITDVGLSMVTFDGTNYWTCVCAEPGGGGEPPPDVTGASIALHDTTHSPVGLWQFQGNNNDSSGNSFNLTDGSSVSAFVDMAGGGGILGGRTWSNVLHYQASSGTSLAITGDITILFLSRYHAYGTGWTVAYFGPAGGETEADNILYSVGLNFAGGIPFGLSWLSEHGAGLDDRYDINISPALGDISHVAARRSSNVIQFFLDGLPVGSASSALTTPTGSSNGRFGVGAPNGPVSDVAVASVKVVAGALSNAEILAERNLCLAAARGEI